MTIKNSILQVRISVLNLLYSDYVGFIQRLARGCSSVVRAVGS